MMGECMHLDTEEVGKDSDGCIIERCKTCGDQWNTGEV